MSATSRCHFKITEYFFFFLAQCQFHCAYGIFLETENLLALKSFLTFLDFHKSYICKLLLQKQIPEAHRVANNINDK